MQRRHVALLRAISNVPMLPFRQSLEELGFTDVESYGSTGNLLFNAAGSDTAALERRIAQRLDIVTLVRTRAELARVAKQDPFGGHVHTAVMFLTRAPTTARRREFLQLDFQEPAPVLRGRTVFYLYPARLRGKRAPFDLERALGVQGTFRTARVVAQILARMSGTQAKSRISRVKPR